jgi:hypothetical protein
MTKLIMKNFIYLCLVTFMVSTACSSESIIPDSEDEYVEDEIVEGGDESEDSVEDNSIPDLPYDEIPKIQYIIDVEYWDIPIDGTEAVKTTENLQAAIDWAVGEGYGVIRLPAGHYLIGEEGSDIYQSGIELASNMAFVLDEDAIIEMVPNDKWNYSVIAITRKEYVVIMGGTILGDRDDHTYTARESDGKTNHDEGHCITVGTESNYVTVKNMTLSQATGDGILLYGSPVRNVTIQSNDIYYNRRQGVSVVGAEGVLIEDNEIHHIEGTSPQFGIDIEGPTYGSSDIVIRSNYFHNNKGGDVVNFEGQDVIIEENTMEQKDSLSYADAPIVYHKNSDQIIRNNEIILQDLFKNPWNAIIMYPSDGEKTNSETTYIYSNTVYNGGFTMMQGADLNIYDNNLTNGHLCFYEITNLTLTNNNIETDRSDVWAYRFLQVSGVASENKLNDVLYSIPLSSELWDGNWVY